MLTVAIFLPLAVAAALPAVPRRAVPWTWIAVTLAEVALAAWMWAAHGTGAGISYEANVRWIPSVRAGYHVGVDGLSLPLIALTAVLFAACAVYSLRQTHRVRAFAMLFLFLETVCLGLFAALDLLLFFVFFDLSIVGMYFVILLWGHGDRSRSALKFFLYTFLGSLVLLLGFIGLYLGADPHTFDMVDLTRGPPLHGGLAGLTLLAIGIGLGIKTPVVPFHTWLPPAHTDAPAAGSAILAGVMLKMGTYGLVRIAMPMLPDAWRRYALVFLIVGLVGVLYGALVALAQDDLKRLVAYTSVNHMGYIVLALGAAGYASGDAGARRLAVTGAVTQMVSHGLVTGALFLLCGVLHDRAGSYDLRRFGGIARGAPAFAGLIAVAAFASLGLPGLSGFIAEFQIFAGTIGSGTAAAAVTGALAVLGILITAALFLRVLHRAVLGPPGELTGRVTDVRRPELAALVPLLLLSLLIGVAPRGLLDTIEPLSAAVVALVGR
ncbi:complex I subunit 4 family protein [Actinomadura bangladeshensis]|uniref:NADH-quinone oxidoreductase subunit M n=1 Tax=Actinomadura bangladeshensis TaxID=453573 RepID=A0A6L9QJM7_9ACTN|nr:NADH-quinone oxidoreductase subunit M [Actinomadura bangladeshensis]NEA25525.1 NADH-quinone oxidoreductase subunit M [Actinomadura bangladeshensis]